MKCEMVRDWMVPDPITIGPQTTLPEAHRLMLRHSIRRLPVIQDGRLVGIVTLGDLRGAEPSDACSLSIWELNYLLCQTEVEEIMTPRPYTVSADASVGEAAQLMLAHKISALPVLDEEGRLVGIITESDVFRMVVCDWLQQAEPALGI
ncbi:MAG: CBS domain-containing protein [Anaerolineae bacterium]|nr:CBS domain-containing protein [Anaerolineae bacterium]